jgi:hypothetical protein
MSYEDLMKPRYKVIADYPGCPFKVGEILQKTKYMSGKEFVRGMLHQPDDYPANFQRLEWWQDRAETDPPEYVKRKGIVYKVDRWSKSFQNIHWLGCYVSNSYMPCEELTPATETDYNTCKKENP